ncbi:TraX family protein [Salinarimonas soli]|uniref:Uncharacterized protein n=1 Tax=Salinarimonas soli TaxID=1638099 RepID=A0A5B2V9J5_9HYPH|nr:TraX family protein [Salinarimonas soli]KAA2235009.1 hypothetical protein F0L46_21975 [Salinarimonas soli]
MTADPAGTDQPAVTTTDWWKIAAVALMLVDHVGLYFFPDESWWRLIGRATAPIFFFLVGYATSRRVPWTWLAFGAILTAIDVAHAEDPSDWTINILFNFALIRWARPHLEAWIGESRMRLVLLMGALAGLVPLIGDTIEYGTEGWLWALYGIHQRRAGERGTMGAASTRNAVAALAALVYITTEFFDFGFDLEGAFALALIVGVETVLLAGFSRAVSARQPPAVLRPAIGFIGRHTLELYALHLLAFEAITYAVD